MADSLAETVPASPKKNIHIHTSSYKYPLVMTNIGVEDHHAIHGKMHYQWPFSIVMLNYQRVHVVTPDTPHAPLINVATPCGHPNPKIGLIFEGLPSKAM